MITFNELKKLILETEKDMVKFSEKGNKSAGTRVRLSMQEAKKLAQRLRMEIQEEKNK